MVLCMWVRPSLDLPTRALTTPCILIVGRLMASVIVLLLIGVGLFVLVLSCLTPLLSEDLMQTSVLVMLSSVCLLVGSLLVVTCVSRLCRVRMVPCGLLSLSTLSALLTWLRILIRVLRLVRFVLSCKRRLRVLPIWSRLLPTVVEIALSRVWPPFMRSFPVRLSLCLSGRRSERLQVCLIVLACGADVAVFVRQQRRPPIRLCGGLVWKLGLLNRTSPWTLWLICLNSSPIVVSGLTLLTCIVLSVLVLIYSRCCVLLRMMPVCKWLSIDITLVRVRLGDRLWT